MMYGTTETTPLVRYAPQNPDEIEMQPLLSGRVYEPTTAPIDYRPQQPRFTRNQKIALFGLALLILGGTVAALLYHFLSGNESSAPVTPSPFSPTTGSTGTTFSPTTWFSSTTGHTTTDLTSSSAMTTTAATTVETTTSSLPTTSTPFMTTTTGSTTTGTTADPRCAFEPECCDAGQWIC